MSEQIEKYKYDIMEGFYKLALQQREELDGRVGRLEKALAVAKEALEDSIAPINFANQESSPPYYYDPVLNKVNEAISKIMEDTK